MAFDSAAPINRRTVAKGIAWSVPAVAIAGAAPAFATSHCTPVVVIDVAASCKIANQSSYKLAFNIEGDNCDPGACTGTITRIYENTGLGRTIWTGSVAADGVATAQICNTAFNMSNFVNVVATINCGGTITQFDGKVDMPQFTSANSTCADDFCTPAT